MEQAPLLATKLYIPPVRPELVSRPRLIERLNAGLGQTQGVGSKLILISAPAGFGKTTLVSEWIHLVGAHLVGAQHAAPQVAWLSLDEGDNDPTRFLSYLIAALQTLEADVGKGVLSALYAPQPPSFDIVLTSLINEIAAHPDRILLVLDDYHLIEAQAIHDALTFLLERLPPQMHLVIAGREDPPLPLARLRARGQLTELRATDLRFTTSEASEFLNQAMGLDLSAEDIAALETRTEGWIAGLQLAAISMKGHDDVTNLIRAFTGSHRYVLDYLMEEVLEQQPKSLQTFLLQTSVLERLTGSLCDAVLFGIAKEPSTARADAVRFGEAESPAGEDDGQAILEMLDRANLFIVPLDNERHWYRYHHLFADLLRQRLHQTQPEHVLTLHRQAGRWYEDQGLAAEALHHIFAAGDFQWAVRLVEQLWTATLWKQGDMLGLVHWLERFPESVLHSRPKLCLISAYAMPAFQPDDVEALLRSAESHLREAEDRLVIGSDRLTETVDASSEGTLSISDVQTMMADVAAIRGATACRQGDLTGSIELYNRALELAPSNELLLQARVKGGLADSYCLMGDIAAASPLYVEARAICLDSGNIHVGAVFWSRLAEIQVLRGHLHQSADSCQQMQHLFTRLGEQHISLAGYACVGVGEVLCEWNDLDEAVQQLREGIEYGKQAGNPRILLLGYVTLTRALQALGDGTGALGAIQEAMQVWQQFQLTRGWVLPPPAPYQARLWLAQGNIAATAQWVQERGLRADGALDYQHEVDYLTLARLLIAQDNADEAARLLERLLQAAEAGGRIGRVIEMLVLQALALQGQAGTAKAMTALERALSLAEPEGFVRTFVDEGPPMARLLYEALSRGIAPDYVRRLLAAFADIEPEQPEPTKSQVPETELIEPLSERELQVLQLIAEGLTNREIASRLFLALNTVKAHTRNIYGKLGVHNRTQAVVKARALGILPPI